MKLLRVVGSLDPAEGGLSQAIRSSAPDLEKLGISTEVVTCDSPDVSWLGQDTFPVHALGPRQYGFAYTPKLGPWLDENLSRFDAVIIDGLWLWPSVCATRAIARHRRAVTSGQTSEHGSDSLRVTRNPRLFVMPHGMLDPWFQRDKSRRVKAVRNWFYWWLVERGVVNSADALLFTCQQELELARTTFGGYRPKKEVVVGLGIEEPPVFEPKMQEAFEARCPDLNGRPYLLFMSRVHPKKNVAALVRAYARVRGEVTSDEWRVASDGTTQGPKDKGTNGLKSGALPDLVVAGPGWDTDYGREVRALIDEANRSIASAEHRTLPTANSACLHAVDMLQGDAKWGALYGCKAFVLPSHQENFGIAVVEALASGKPVLISDQVNIWREIVEDGAGFAEEDTEEGVEMLFKRFIAQEKASELAKRARECYLNRFAIGPAVASLSRALKED